MTAAFMNESVRPAFLARKKRATAAPVKKRIYVHSSIYASDYFFWNWKYNFLFQGLQVHQI
jgi:hypothetical protein